MTGYARSYTQRRADIAEKLRAYVDFRSLVPTNAEPAFEPDLFENSLMCSWGDPQTGDTKLFVYIHQVPDGDDEAERLRQTLAEESTPAEAYENRLATIRRVCLRAELRRTLDSDCPQLRGQHRADAFRGPAE